MKVVVVGSSAVGKSAITIRFVRNEFVERYSPTLEDSYQIPVRVDDKVEIVEVIDTAGSDFFTQIKDMYYYKADAFLLVCSVDNSGSLTELHSIKRNICRVKETENVPMVVCVNKIDLPQQNWQHAKNETNSELDQWNIPYFYTSAKTSKNIQEAINSLIRTTHKSECKKTECKMSKKLKNRCVVM